MGSNKILTLFILLLVSSPIYAQDNREPERKELEKRTEEFLPEVKPGDDFRITGSTNSYIEIEFNPIYTNAFDFIGAISRETVGSPDVKFRSFPLFLPTAGNNRVEILDYKYEDIPNVDILPVPTPIRSKDNLKIDFDFRKNEEVYRVNGFYPVDAASLDGVSLFRNKYFANALVNPVLYNPVTKTVRRYTYIKFRVTYGGSPIITNKQQSYEEMLFYRDLAINSNVSLNWSTPDFNNMVDSYPTSSVLQSGDYYKIEVRETGMYKLDKTFLQNAGINTDGIDPRTIKIYGNGGREIPFNNSIPFPTDLIENNIMVAGEDDGVFNDGDYVVFFGRSQSDWQYTPSVSSIAPYNHYMNPFSKSNYYWITFGGNNGLRMQTVNSPNNPSASQYPYFTDKFFDEAEVNNLGSTGTLWFSQRIGPGESFNFNKSLPGYVSGQPVEINALYGNGTHSTSAYFELSESTTGYNAIFQVFGHGSEFSHIYLSNHRFTITPGSENINFRISLPSNLNSPTVIGYYDWVEFKYPRRFSSAVNNYLGFQANDTTGLFEYNLSTFTTSDVNIFDVTDEYNITRISPISYSGGTARFQTNHTSGTPGQYYAVGGSNYKTPLSISSKITNQNLHGITDGASFIIISPKEFMTAAQRLKNLRERPGPSYLKTMIVDIDEIYNEFSGGLLDPLAVRNFLKKAFYTWNERPVYVLFLGDGHYDYRNIYNLPAKNYLPPMQKSSLSSDEIESYPSDDFVTNIHDTLGGNVQAVKPDFSIGRLCVNSLNEANTYIDKLIKYEDPSSYGYWKKKNMYVADDGWTTSNPGGEGALHTVQCEEVAEIWTSPDFEKEKIYIANYPTVITPQGRRKPQANVDIIRGWNEGRLVINYTGHGSTDLWAHEQIFERQSSIPQLNNSDRYPFVTIASCDLARYDDPFFPSAAEELTNLSNRGSIGIIAAVRPVYASSNAAFNNILWNNFINQKDTLNLPIRIGRAVFNTKQIRFGDNDAKYTLLCDPTLRISIPQYFTRIDSINNVSGSDTAVLKALQKVTIKGSVLRPDSTFWNDYNGDIFIKIFDVSRFLSVFDLGHYFNFRLDGGLIFAGRTNVTNGTWELEFVVPKDISYRNGRGKLIGYFNNSNTEGSGYTDKFILNGIDSTAAVDTTGPQIDIFIGDRNFRSGDVVNQNSTLISDFFDENGMNLTGTIGHKIEAIINNNENSKIDLTPFYNATSGYQNGSLEYLLENLESGDYNVKIKAWDTYNNYSVSSVDFKVMNNSSLALENIYNYPNPMQDNTSFLFNHNFDAPLDVRIKIYTVSGRLIKELNQSNITDKFVKIDWDGRDDDGDNIANGTYIYRLVVKSQDGNFNETSTGKIAKLK
jgi:hypothetical protein